MNDIRFCIDKQTAEYPSYCPVDLDYNISPAYQRDSFYYKESDSFLLFIGVCYNKNELAPFSVDNWPAELFSQFQKDCKSVLKMMDGNFCGVYYDAQHDDTCIFSDHLSSNPAYYYQNRSCLLIDTDLFRLAAEMRKRGFPVRLSEFGAYSMLAYSFMLDDYTPLADVYKVRAASVYSCRQNRSESYFDYYSQEKTGVFRLSDIAEGVNTLFDQAVKDSLQADLASSHLFTLSGGLDSRMLLFYAIKNGCCNITTLNYSQSFYREEAIAKKIAADCGCEHIFVSLDNAGYLFYIDEGVRATQGMTTYRPILSARMIWKRLQMENYHYVYNGLLGDTILGGYCIEKCNPDDRFHSPTDFAIQLNSKNKSILSAPYYEEFLPLFNCVSDWISPAKLYALPSEKFVLDNRYINGLMHSALGTKGLAALSSPYTSKRLMQYVFSYPSSLRVNHDLYFAWMNTYMPAAAKYQWENTGLRPMYGPIAIKPNNRLGLLLKHIDSAIHPNKPEHSRNPYSYWMKQNGNIQKELCAYSRKKLFLLEGYPELLNIAGLILKHNNIYLLTRLATLLGFFSFAQFEDSQEKSHG